MVINKEQKTIATSEFIDSQAKEIRLLKEERHELMVILANAMGYQPWIGENGCIWPADSLWGAHSPLMAAEVVCDETVRLRACCDELKKSCDTITIRGLTRIEWLVGGWSLLSFVMIVVLVLIQVL